MCPFIFFQYIIYIEKTRLVGEYLVHGHAGGAHVLGVLEASASDLSEAEEVVGLVGTVEVVLEVLGAGRDGDLLGLVGIVEGVGGSGKLTIDAREDGSTSTGTSTTLVGRNTSTSVLVGDIGKVLHARLVDSIILSDEGHDSLVVAEVTNGGEGEVGLVLRTLDDVLNINTGKRGIATLSKGDERVGATRAHVGIITRVDKAKILSGIKNTIGLDGGAPVTATGKVASGNTLHITIHRSHFFIPTERKMKNLYDIPFWVIKPKTPQKKHHGVPA